MMFDSASYIKQLLLSDRTDIRIVALFAKAKGYTFENKGQFTSFLKRHIRAANGIKDYPLPKIIAVMKYLKDTAKYKWTIETVGKHIDEDIDLLSGKTPIITLKNGKNIFNTEEITGLEKAGVIEYKGGRWREV